MALSMFVLSVLVAVALSLSPGGLTAVYHYDSAASTPRLLLTMLPPRHRRRSDHQTYHDTRLARHTPLESRLCPKLELPSNLPCQVFLIRRTEDEAISVLAALATIGMHISADSRPLGTFDSLTEQVLDTRTNP